jgi:hypothetical protein
MGVLVEVQDQFGNRVDTDNFTQVRLTVVSGLGTFTAGTPVQKVSGGRACFPDLVITTAAPGYTLQASAPNLESVDSATFTIIPGQARQLVFLTPPTTTLAGEPINAGTGVQVEVEDWYGNRLIDDNTDQISLEIVTGPGGFTIGGIPPVTVTGGSATFTNLALNTAGDYTLRASAPNLTPASSTPPLHHHPGSGQPAGLHHSAAGKHPGRDDVHHRGASAGCLWEPRQRCQCHADPGEQSRQWYTPRDSDPEQR